MQTIRFKGLTLVIADDRMAKTIQMAEKATRSLAPVLLCGESGTGKELVARYIHEKSRHSQGPYVSINCAAIPDGLMEAELFGFEKGAFTGAVSVRIGKFEQANHGTILLDEISEMSVHLQAKLLRVLQEGEVDRLGGKGVTKINARVIATTNKDPLSMIQSGLFREDLFYRLNVIRIECEPLRGRPDAVQCLVREFVKQSCLNQGKEVLQITQGAMDKLMNYEWPGNVRELQNTIERAILTTEGQALEREHICLTGPLISVGRSDAYRSLADVEREHIKKVLETTGGNRTEAARILDINVRTLRNKLREYRYQ